MVHDFYPSTREAEAGGWISEFKASLVYRADSGTARATQKDHALKTKVKTKPKIMNKK